MTRRATAIVALVLAGAACSPEFDWRQISSDEGRFTAALPGRPRHESRPLVGERSGKPVEGGVTMQMWSAQAAGTIFAVGYADHPGADRRFLDATRDAQVANVGGRISDERELANKAWSGRQVAAEGRAEETPGVLRLRLVLKRGTSVSVCGARAARCGAYQ